MRKEERKLYKERCNKFVERAKKDFVQEYFAPEVFYAKTQEHLKFGEHLTLEYKKIEEGDDWGVAWDSAWFHITAVIPEEWQNRDIVLQLNCSGESLLFDSEGTPLMALTGYSAFDIHFVKEYFHLTEAMKQRGKVDLWVEAAANSLGGVFLDSDPHVLSRAKRGHFEGKVQKMRLGIWESELWNYHLEFRLLYDFLCQLPEDDYRYTKLLSVMSESLDIYSNNSLNSLEAKKVLEKIFKQPALASALSVSAVGHAHIDTAWLWPVRESIRKCARTFSSQIANIEKYPEYIFGASQAQHYQFVKEHYPYIYEKIKEKVKEGRWEIQGGMWVEADCNIISGESMVRQFLHGKNFFMEEFGFEPKSLWLPDVFGYSAAMPQIIKKSNCDYFLTQKISWNQFNEFPHHTFFWEGIDGSQVLTHFPPENNYNARMLPELLLPAQNRFNELGIVDEFVSLYGTGDGGGGPKDEHIERAKLLSDFEGMPKVKFSRSDDFFERLNNSDAVKKDRLHKWVGELYLEFHRGTFTTQAKTKKNNRKIEQTLSAIEFLYSMVDLSFYPSETLDKMWKLLLLNQFHDIIPGSSIAEVYKTTEEEHAKLLEDCGALISQAQDLICDESEGYLTLVNTLSTPYTQAITLPESWQNYEIFDLQNNPILCCDNRALGSIPKSGLAVWRKGAPKESTKQIKSSLILENELIRYEFNSQGELISGFDKEAQIETIVSGKSGNVFTMYSDRPNNYEAWDIDPFYMNEESSQAEIVNISQQESTVLGSRLEFTFKIGESSIIKQEVELYCNSKRLDFRTNIDWQECRKMVRVNFPISIKSNEASCEIQYGYVKRPTHSNTSWDMAKFEVVHHRYVDISDYNYGVSLLNDCKYGCRVNHGELDLCLLRSPKFPDFYADITQHEFTYSYLPHCGDLIKSNTWSEASQLNRPVVVFENSIAKVQAPFYLEGEDISLEVVKCAERSSNHIIRLVEKSGKQSSTILKTTLDEGTLKETNLLEWDVLEELEFKNRQIKLDFSPFEIRTFIISKG